MSKKLVDHLELYEKLHFHELESRQKLVVRMQVSFGLVIALAGGQAFIVQNFDKNASGPVFIMFLPLLLCGVASFFWTTYYLRRTFFDHSYKEMDLAANVRDYEKKLHDYYFTEPKPPELLPPTKRITARELFDAAFKEYLLDRFVATTTHNAVINDARAEHLHLANQGIIHSVAYTVLAFTALVFGGLRAHETTDVNIVTATATPAPAALTDEQLRSQICRLISESRCSANDHTELKQPTAAAAKGSTGAASGTADQRGRQSATPANASAAKKVKIVQQAEGGGQSQQSQTAPVKEPPQRPPERDVREQVPKPSQPGK